MKKAISILFILLMCLSILPVSAARSLITSEKSGEIIDSGACGENAEWTLTEDGTLTISGTGETYDYNSYGPGCSSNVPWGYYYEYDYDSYGAGYYACKTIKSIVIGDNITALGSCLFKNCICIENVSMPYGLKRIGNSTFENARALETIVFPNSVVSIGSYAFYRCSALETIVFPDELSIIGKFAFCLCESLTSIELSKAVPAISESAFESCIALKYVVLSDGITEIGNSAFRGCSSLESIKLPAHLYVINHYTFSACSSLKSVYLSPVQTIMTTSFNNSNAIKDVYYPGSKETWKAYSFDKFFTKATKHYYYNYNYIPYCSASIKYATYAYKGTEIKPTVTLTTASGTKLTKGTHYTVSYKNNIDYGTATITVTGKGKYYGTQTITFKIRPAKVKDLKVVSCDGSTAVVSWTTDPLSEKYKVCLGADLVGYTKADTYTVSGLVPGKARKIWVYAIGYKTDPDTGERIAYKSNGSYVWVNK